VTLLRKFTAPPNPQPSRTWTTTKIQKELTVVDHAALTRIHPRNEQTQAADQGPRNDLPLRREKPLRPPERDPLPGKGPGPPTENAGILEIDTAEDREGADRGVEEADHMVDPARLLDVDLDAKCPPAQDTAHTSSVLRIQ